MKRSLSLFLSLAVLGAGCAVSQGPTGDLSVPSPASSGTTTTVPASGTVLDLSGRGLSSIPSDVFSRTDLTRLDLSGNRLTGAPQSQIGQLTRLTSLDLSNNDLTGLPAELGHLKQLQTLDVSNNRLTGLPMELGELTQLRILDVSGNPYSTQDLDAIAAKLPNTEIRR